VKLRNILIGFIILVLIIVGVLFVSKKVKTVKTPVSPVPPSIEQQVESKFNGLTIPMDSARIELKDVSGGRGMGIATRSEILADLPGLNVGQKYQGYLENSSGKTVLLGTLKAEKGGWILNFDSAKYPEYNKVIVTQGTKHILEGSF
jgi:hypothetical protein